MELKRVVGRLGPRWPVLVIVGLIAAIIAFVFVQQRNAEVEPVYRATASVEIEVAPPEGGGRPTTEIPEELATAYELAQTVNEEQLASPTRELEADSETNMLTFVAIARTEEEAIAGALSMRADYVAADSNFDVNAELEEKLSEAEVISARLDDLIPDPEDPVLPTAEEAASSESQLTLLQSRETAINSKINELQDTLLDTTDSEEISGINSELESLRARLEELLVTLRPLEAAAAEAAEAANPQDQEQVDTIDPSLPIADQWSIQALQARLDELQIESQNLIVASVTGAGIELPDVEVVDESPSITPTWLGLLVGFLVGVILWSAVLIGFDRARGIIWQAGDIKTLPVLAEGPGVSINATDITDLDRQRRKRSVQAIRSAIIGAGRIGGGTIVGFASPPSTDPDVRDDLAFDVASSLSAVGRSVLLVDLGFTGNSLSAGPIHDRSGLRELFDSVTDDEATIRERAAIAIQQAERRTQGLDVLTADSDVIDPADILAGRPLTELLEQARERYDIVAVIQPTTTVNSGAGVDAYLQQQVIVGTRGKTRMSEINSTAIARDAAHVQMVGVALLIPGASQDKGRSRNAGVDGAIGDGVGQGEFGERRGKVSSAFKRLGNEKESEKSLERLRSLESYSVEESALLQSSESGPERQ